MRSYFFASTLAGLVLAAPAPVPQDIDFDLAYAVPNPSYSIATTGTAQTIVYTPAAILSSAASQITATEDNASQTVTAVDKVKRTACAAQPTGAGPVPTPDTAAAFLSDADFANAALSAPVPSGYTQTFSNLTGSNNAYGYMGYTTLKSYDSAGCAAKCNNMNGCMAVNIYYERDPSVDPGTGASGCTNPASTTNIKCVFWGGPVTADNAVNMGQWRNQFQVVIAGSNGYVNNSIAQVPGYSGAVPLGNAAINAPYDKYGFNTFLGDTIFNNGPFNASLCGAACSMKSSYALAHPPTDGSPPATCQFFNTYILYINNTNNLQGQYCAMYSESWSSSYATNVGQYRGNDHFLIEYSYAYSNATNPGAPNANAAAHQAAVDIEYPANSALPYCSSLLGYTIPVTTSTTSTTTTLPASTITVETTSSTTVTDVVNAKRTAASQTSSSVPIPNVLTKYPASIIASGCSLAVTSPTSTSTSTVVVTATATPSPVTITDTTTTSSTTTVTSTTSSPTPSLSNFYIKRSDTGLYGVASNYDSNNFNSVTVTFTARSATGATAFSIDASTNHLIDESGTVAVLTANEDADQSVEPVYFNPQSQVGGGGFLPAICSFDSSYNLDCSINGGSTNSVDGNGVWNLGPASAGTDITIVAVAA